MSTLRDWVISVLGEPIHYVRVQTSSTNWQNITVQYDWAFITGALLLLICLWGFITILRMLFSHRR